MPYPGSPFQFSAEEPIRIVLGPSDTAVYHLEATDTAIQGTVEIHLVYAQEKQVEQVDLTFAATVKTFIHRGESRRWDSEELVPPRVVRLWRVGEAFPPPGEHVLAIPFTCSLPSNAPPSFNAEGYNCTGKVRYKIEVEGHRNVSFGTNILLKRYLTIIPWGLNVNVGREHPGGGDIVLSESAEMRRSTFKSGKGGVTMELRIQGKKYRPFPVDQNIPFSVTLTTISVPVRETPEPGTDKDALYPSMDPDGLHYLLKFRLKRYTNVRVRTLLGNVESADIDDHELALLGYLNKMHGFTVDIGHKEWIAIPNATGDMKGKGSWKQKCTFHSTLNLSSQFATPTFKHELIDTTYALALECTIPAGSSFGSEHSVKIKFPIVISSRLPAAPVLSDADVGQVYKG